jgi:hypothetical protein
MACWQVEQEASGVPKEIRDSTLGEKSVKHEGKLEQPDGGGKTEVSISDLLDQAMVRWAKKTPEQKRRAHENAAAFFASVGV